MLVCNLPPADTMSFSKKRSWKSLKEHSEPASAIHRFYRIMTDAIWFALASMSSWWTS